MNKCRKVRNFCKVVKIFRKNLKSESRLSEQLKISFFWNLSKFFYCFAYRLKFRKIRVFNCFSTRHETLYIIFSFLSFQKRLSVVVFAVWVFLNGSLYCFVIILQVATIYFVYSTYFDVPSTTVDVNKALAFLTDSVVLIYLMWFVVWFVAFVAAVSIIASENESEINIEMELKEI